MATSQFTGYILSLPGHDWMVAVDKQFNLEVHNKTGFREQLTFYKYALQMLFDIVPKDLKSMGAKQTDTVHDDALKLYGLMHSRYIQSSQGQTKMLQKWAKGTFGLCTDKCRFDQVPLLPIGLSDHPEEETVRLFCPKCEEVTRPKQREYARLDGAYFGTVYHRLMFMFNPEYYPDPETSPQDPLTYCYVFRKVILLLLET